VLTRFFQSLFGPETTARHAGWFCLAAALGLSAIGIYAIDLSERFDPAHPADAGGMDLSHLAVKQLIFAGAGIIAALVVLLPDPRHLRAVAWPAMGLSVLLLIFLLIPVVPAWLVSPRNGVRGWINLGPIDVQPAELARIAFVLAAAEWLRHSRRHRTLLGLIPPAAITAVPVGLIFLQPDLGLASLFVPAIFAMLVAAGARLKHLLLVVLVAMAAAPAAYPFLKPYQQQRIIGLLGQLRGEQAMADDINYQALTAQMLVGAGGTTGYDDARARAVIRYAQLPERHNDMILAVIIARFGLAGGLLLVALYLLWLTGALLTAATTKDPFARLVCVGLSAFIAVQVVINLGMVVGVLPIVGLTLPFVSYGGSSMLSVWIMTGLIFSFAMRRPPRLARASFEFRD
jgi:rod shape determining protein RodA